jgi:hypothetical protein
LLLPLPLLLLLLLPLLLLPLLLLLLLLLLLPLYAVSSVTYVCTSSSCICWNASVDLLTRFLHWLSNLIRGTSAGIT